VLGAERIIAIETVPERIAMARKAGATDIVDFTKEDVFERIKEISKGEGAGCGDRLRRHGSEPRSRTGRPR
jgi:threonine dehydrogenase-like Zn-dependent dehydrogenase